MDDLVSRLSARDHHVVVSLRPQRTVDAFKECLDRGYVHIKFTETQGGTELGVSIDCERTDVKGADFASRSGRVCVVGVLTLDDVRVRCTAHIDLPSLEGVGRLEIVEA